MCGSSTSVANHKEGLGQRQYMVDALDAAVGARALGAGVDAVDATAVVHDGRKLGGKPLPVVREERHRAPPTKMSFKKDVSGADGRENS